MPCTRKKDRFYFKSGAVATTIIAANGDLDDYYSNSSKIVVSLVNAATKRVTAKLILKHMSEQIAYPVEEMQQSPRLRGWSDNGRQQNNSYSYQLDNSWNWCWHMAYSKSHKRMKSKHMRIEHRKDK